MCVRFYRLRGYALLIQSSIQVLREKDSDCLYNIQKTGSRNKTSLSQSVSPERQRQIFYGICTFSEARCIL